MNSNEDRETKKKNALEWTVFGGSLVILLGVVTILIHQAVTLGNDPALLVVQTGTPLSNLEQTRVPVNVSNEGDLPAISAEIEVRCKMAGEEQVSSIQFDFISSHSRRDGWVSFTGAGNLTELKTRVIGYVDP